MADMEQQQQQLDALLHPMLPGPRAVRIAGAATVVGRSQLNTAHKLVSKQHLRVNQPASGEFTICDQSTNGTWLNGERLTKNSPHELQSGDIVTLLSAANIEFALVFVKNGDSSPGLVKVLNGMQAVAKGGGGGGGGG